MTDDLSLTAHVVKLATMREELAQRQAQLDDAMKPIITQFAPQQLAITTLKADIARVEADIRGLAVVAYDLDATKSKTPAPGITVDVTPEVTIKDREGAFAWSKASQIGYLAESFDESAVLSMFTGKRPKMQPLPFVEVKDGVPKVSIAKDLGKALADVQERAA